MGCCFSEEQTGNEPNATTPLLAEKAARPATNLPVTSQPGGDHTAQSARRHRPHSDSDAELDIGPLTMKPVKVSAVDKRLQDHTQLFNEHLQRRDTLRHLVEELKTMFPEHAPANTLVECFRHVRSMTKETEITATRKFKYCVELSFVEKDVHYSVMPALLNFNKANRIIKEIMDKGPPLVNSVDLVTKGEKELRRDVLVASLGGEGPDCLKNCMDNIAELKKVPDAVDKIRREAVHLFEELTRAIQIILKENSL